MSLFNDKEFLRQIIITHYDKPIHKIESESEISEKYSSYHNKSSSCIDDIKVFLLIENNLIKDAKFSGIGCAISTASTDILCNLIINKSKQEADIIFNNYNLMINNESYDEEILDELIAFKDIYKQQNRIKCSLIGLTALKEVLGE